MVFPPCRHLLPRILGLFGFERGSSRHSSARMTNIRVSGTAVVEFAGLGGIEGFGVRKLCPRFNGPEWA